VRFLFTLLVLAILPLISVALDQPAGAWLDSPAPVQWNQPPAKLPMPPKDGQKNVTPEYCKSHEHPVKLQEERAAARAGWLVFVSYQGGRGVTVVGGAAGEDGMCRPDPYQFFVFVRGRVRRDSIANADAGAWRWQHQQSFICGREDRRSF
jgi:hypothetical protein